MAGCSFKKNPTEKDGSGNKVSANRTHLLTDEEALWNIVVAGRLYDLQLFIEQNPDIDLNASWRGETALSVALRRGDFEIAAVLMSYGASPFVPLQVDGKSAFDSVDLYPARFRAVITSQVELTMAHLSKSLETGSTLKIVEVFAGNSIPCEMTLEKLRDVRSRNSRSALNDAAAAILNHDQCKNISSQRLAKIFTQEFFDILRSYSGDLALLKTLAARIPHRSTIVAENQNLIGILNPFFLVKFRQICGNPFSNESDLVAWRYELSSLFPDQSGMAYEIAVQKENRIQVGSGRALISDFESMDRYDERRSVVVSLTGIKNFFECEEEH
nr:hypothetical protein HAGR004_06850 [Bdellovibrio sp. HAGR004]